VTPDIRVRFGNRLRQLRHRQGWTQEELADVLGLDRSYIAEIELGKRNVCLKNIEVIAKGFKVSMGQLFSRL